MYVWRRGSTFSLGLRVKSGTVAGDEIVTAQIKKATDDNLPPGDDAEILIECNVTFVPAAGQVAAHWLFTASVAQGEALDAGIYIIDARIEDGDGFVMYASPVLIKVAERVTEP